MKNLYFCFILVLVQVHSLSQDENPDDFKRNYNLLKSDTVYVRNDSATVVLRSESQKYMETLTGIKAEPCVNFITIRPYRQEDLNNWRKWGIEHGLYPN